MRTFVVAAFVSVFAGGSGVAVAADAARPASATPAASAPAAAAAVTPITAEQLIARQRAKDASLFLLDVRTPEEFAEGHVPGAVNVPHDQVEKRLAELDSARGKDVVLYCRSGRRAGLAADVLSRAGFRKLQHLEGDMQGWTAAGRPVEK